MARFTGATLSVLGGLAGALFVAGAVATGCGGDDNGGGNNSTSTNATTKSSSSTGSNSTGTTSATSSTSATSASSGDAGDAGDAGDGKAPDASDAGDGGDSTVPSCNTAALLNIDAGNLLFSFNDGGIAMTVGTQSVNWGVAVDMNPLDAGFGAVAQGNPTVGDTCPGSLELIIPFTTTGQGVAGSFAYPGLGVPYNAKAIHFALKFVIANDADASPAFLQELIQTDGSGFSYLTPYAQWTPALADGGQLDASYQAQNFTTAISGGFSGFPSDGGWLLTTVPITAADPGDGAVVPVPAPTKIYLNQIGVQLRDPQAGADAGPQPLPFPLTLEFFIDDVWFE